MVSALGLNDFAGMGVFVLLQLTGFSPDLGLCRRCTTAARRLRIKDRHDMAQAIAILAKKVAKLLLKFDLTFQTIC